MDGMDGLVLSWTAERTMHCIVPVLVVMIVTYLSRYINLLK